MAGLGDLNMQNPLWATFLFYAGVLGLKTVIMSVWTARHRIANKVFANPEDATLQGSKVKMDHPDVERVRRAHLNDLENVLPFLILCPLYLSTGPSVWLATQLIRAFAAARVLHTIVYINVVPQPSRGLCFAVGFGINMYLAAQLVLKTM